MNDLMIKMYVAVKALVEREEGQDLVEYALLLTMISLGLVSSVGSVATAITTIFSNVSASI